MGVAADSYTLLEPRQSAMVDELAKYVSTESGSYDIAGVNRVGEQLSHAFRDRGFSVDRITETDCGDHIVARRQGSGNTRLLVLVHLDTVWPPGTLAENSFRLEDGRAYGPGVLDMKGGWVVLLGALRALEQLTWDDLAELVVFMTADEELGSPTAREHIAHLAQPADAVLVMEAARPGGNLCIQRSMVGNSHSRRHRQDGAYDLRR